MDSKFEKARIVLIVIALIVTVISIGSAIINSIANARFYKNQKEISSILRNGEFPIAAMAEIEESDMINNNNNRLDSNPEGTGLENINGVPHFNGRPVKFN